MKLLDRYILSTYLKSFFSVFAILMFIFLLQSVWVYISELAGKDLEIEVILKFLLYVSPRIVVLVLPLTILLVSIMVFGNFSENYEFAAMKSTGISLQRAMKSLSVFRCKKLWTMIQTRLHFSMQTKQCEQRSGRTGLHTSTSLERREVCR